MSAKLKSGSGVPPLSQEGQSRDGSATLVAPTGRKKIAQGKERSDAAMGLESQKTSSPEGAKESGGLPQGWHRVALKDMADSIQYGHTASSVERKNGPRFLRITDIQEGRVDWNAVPSCDIPAGDIPKYRLSPGDLVFARTGATTGKSFLIGDCPEALFASYLIRVRVSADVDSRYLAAFFQSPDYWQQIEGGKRGIGQPNVNGKVLGEIQFPLAPLDEQRRIVAEIEKQFTRLEAGVTALRRVLANLKRYRAAVLKAACEGKLVPTEAELTKVKVQSGSGVPPLNQEEKQSRDHSATFETGEQLLQRILAERRKNWTGRGKYKEPAAPDTANLPPIPEGWTWATLESVSEAVGGFAFSSTKFIETGFQVIKMANIRMGKIDLTQRPSFISEVTPDIVEKYSLREGDLVVTLTGTRKKRDYGYVAVVKSEEGLLLNQRIARVRPFPGMNSRFLQLAMQAEHYRDRFFAHETGNVGQGNVGMGAVTKEMITLPPLTEQMRIVAEVERRLSVVEELEAAVSANLQRATRLRQSILKKAFTGEL